MLEMYIESVVGSGEYYQLDLFDEQRVTLNYKLKDMSDIGKVFSTYSQQFLIPGSDNNRYVLSFVFDPDVYFIKPEYINCKIYINKNLFKTGQILINDCKRTNGSITSYSLNFFTNLTNLKDLVGDDSIGVLSGSNSNVLLKDPSVEFVDESYFKMSWSDDNVLNHINLQSTDDIIVPLISNNRVIEFGSTASGAVNVNWVDSSKKYPQAISKKELYPAIRYSRIIDRIQEYYGLSFSSPLFDRNEYKNLFVYCNNPEDLYESKNKYIMNVDEPFVLSIGSPSIYRATNNPVTDIFGVTRTSNVNKDLDGFGVQIYTNQEDALGATVSFTFINTTPGHEGEILYQHTKQFANDITGSVYSYYTYDIMPLSYTQVPVGFYLNFKIQIETSKKIEIPEAVYYMQEFTSGIGQTRYTSRNNTNVVKDLFTSMPNIKVIDFLSSFFKMFNIRVLDNVDSKTLTLLTPSDFDINTEVDYTDYANIDNVPQKKVDKYKSYNFKHKTPSYFSNVEYAKLMVNNENSKEYGQLLSNSKNFNITSEYKVETNYSIAIPTLIPNTRVQTFYGFTNDSPTVTTENSITFKKYKANNKDFTIFYYNGLSDILTNFEVEDIFTGIKSYLMIPWGYYKENTNTCVQLNSYNMVGIDNSYLPTSLYKDGYPQIFNNSLGFKDEIYPFSNLPMTYNLYSNYYDDYVSTITNQNSYLYTYEIYLSPILMNSFDMRNKVIIGNRKYTIQEAKLDLTTGKCSLILNNIL